MVVGHSVAVSVVTAPSRMTQRYQLGPGGGGSKEAKDVEEEGVHSVRVACDSGVACVVDPHTGE